MNVGLEYGHLNNDVVVQLMLLSSWVTLMYAWEKVWRLWDGTDVVYPRNGSKRLGIHGMEVKSSIQGIGGVRMFRWTSVTFA